MNGHDRSPRLPAALLTALIVAIPVSASAQNQAESQQADCASVPAHGDLTQVLREVVAPGDTEANGGLGNHMWAVVVNRAGVVCAITYSGEAFGDQWPGSRTIAAEKAFTANAFSLPGFALSTANLYWPSQPENSLYALATSNPVHEEAFYFGDAKSWGTEEDPVVGRRVGGTMVFGGGLALYGDGGELVGELGVSGHESCTDHVVAWKVRHALNLDLVPAGVTKANDDNIVHDLSVDPATGRMQSSSGYGHPPCSPKATAIAENLSAAFPADIEE
jgi:uncharacterized protein GlcG (DUF336 family)